MVASEGPHKPSRFEGFEVRTTPKPLSDCVKMLTDEQKVVVASMGLGSMLHLNLNHIRGELAKWLVNNYDAKTSLLRTPVGDIKIAPRHVHYVLGLPLGGRKIVISKKTSPKSPMVRLFRCQYGGPQTNYVRCVPVFNYAYSIIVYALYFFLYALLLTIYEYSLFLSVYEYSINPTDINIITTNIKSMIPD